MTTRAKSGKFSTYLAMASFGIGTVFLLLYLVFPKSGYILFAGYCYVLLAILFNTITLLYLSYQFAIHRFNRETIAIRILILLSNIPVALLYLNIVLNNNLL